MKRSFKETTVCNSFEVRKSIDNFDMGKYILKKCVLPLMSIAPVAPLF